MRRKLYYGGVLFSEEVKALLDEKKIKYKVLDNYGKTCQFVYFSVYEDDPIVPMLPNYGVSKRPMIEIIYSKKELSEAEYLTLRPTKVIVNVKNEDTSLERPCAHRNSLGIEILEHETQIGPFEIHPLKKNEKTYFFTNDTGFGYVFVKKAAINVFKKNDVSGLMPIPVYLNKKKNLEAEIVQLLSSNTIYLNDIIIDKEDVVHKCHLCGKLKIEDGPTYQLRLDTSKLILNEDLYQTEPVFGHGIPHSMFLISQRLYRLITEERFDKNILFAPVILH